MRARVQFISRDADNYHIGGFPGLEISALYKLWKLSLEEAFRIHAELYLHERYIDFCENDTVGVVLAKAEQAIGIPQSKPCERGHSLALRIGGDLLRFQNDEVLISTLMKHYPDETVTDVYIVIINVAGEIEIGSGDLRYFIRSHERGKHHYPHVHVTNSSREKSATILILNCEVRENSGLSKKQLKLAKKEIEENGDVLLRYWNMHTDGIEFKTNGRFGPVRIVDEGPLPSDFPLGAFR